jgi:hypothetical protein
MPLMRYFVFVSSVLLALLFVAGFIREMEQVRERAKKLPPGTERNALLEKVRQAEIIDRWLSSPELKAPN